MIIGVDFDGTCVTHEFPKVGREIGAAPVLKRLTDAGHHIILFTMRSHRKEGTADANTLGYDNPEHIELETDTLEDAINWFKKHNIPLYGINENPHQKSWTDSPKPYCHLYIDDAGFGIPLTHSTLVGGEEVGCDRAFVDWGVIAYKLGV